MSNDFLFTSESVSEGHPDKVADQISDAILDAIFEQDPRSRVAAETLTNTGLVVLAGEITTQANVDYIQVARDTITGVISDDKIAQLVRAHFDLRPKGIIQMLDLLRPIYSKTAAYGHFGRDEPEFTWERTDKAAALKAAAEL